MSEPFLAEIKIVGFTFAPRNFALCDGQVLPINQNQSLFSLLGTAYGGDGRTSFALPDMRGRTPLHVDSANPQGQRGGLEDQPLTVQQIPSHTHEAQATSNAAGSTSPGGNLLGVTSTGRFPITPYDTLGIPQALVGTTVANAGTGAGHPNMQPYLVLNYCIALQGVFPSRN